jgi:undecaprenyl-diphosphatase
MLDQLISTNIISLQTETLSKIMLFLTHLGDKYIIALFSVILLIFLLYKKPYLKTEMFILTMGSAVVFSQALKYLIRRPRPLEMLIEKTSFSFPSGHATLAIAFFGMLIYLFKNKIKNKTSRYLFIIINILLILVIGFSRLYLNIHWFTDVLAGFVLGLICIIGSIYVVKKIGFWKKKKSLM